MFAIGGKADIVRGARMSPFDPGADIGHTTEVLFSPLAALLLPLADYGQATGSAVMKTCFTMAQSIFAGIAIGAVAVEGLHAQAKPPAYVIGEIDVTNQDGYAKEYQPAALAVLKAHGGKILSRGDKS